VWLNNSQEKLKNKKISAPFDDHPFDDHHFPSGDIWRKW
jgi:hypothetical protein